MNGDLATYDVETGAALGILPGLRRPRHIRNWRDTGALVFAGAGRLFLGSMRGPVREVDARTLEVVRTLDAPPMSTHNYMALTNDGLLVTAGDDALLAIDTSTGERRWTNDLTADPDPWPCYSFAVAEAVGRFYCGSNMGEVEERDLETGLPTGNQLDALLGEVE